MIKWQIATRARKCTQTGQPFTPEEMVWTYLFRELRPGMPSDFRREDVGKEGRELLGDDVNAAFSQWQSRFKPNQGGDDAEPTAEQKLGPEGLFRRLVEEDATVTLNTRYVLAVMLERRRVLKQVDRRETDEGPLLIYEQAKTGEAFMVLDPQLKLADIVNIQAEVAAQLSGGDSSGAGDS